MTTITLKQENLFVVSPTYNAGLAQLATSALLQGATVKPVGLNVNYEFDGKLLPLAVAKQIKDVAVSIKNYPLFIEIADKDDVVPEGVFGSTNDDGESHTWSTWKKPNHNFLEIDGRIFIGTNAHTHEDLDFEYLVDVLDELVHPTEIQALQANIEEI